MTDKAKAKYNKRPAVTLIKIPITIKDIICPITINKDEQTGLWSAVSIVGNTLAIIFKQSVIVSTAKTKRNS